MFRSILAALLLLVFSVQSHSQTVNNVQSQVKTPNGIFLARLSLIFNPGHVEGTDSNQPLARATIIPTWTGVVPTPVQFTDTYIDTIRTVNDMPDTVWADSVRVVTVDSIRTLAMPQFETMIDLSGQDAITLFYSKIDTTLAGLRLGECVISPALDEWAKRNNYPDSLKTWRKVTK